MWEHKRKNIFDREGQNITGKEKGNEDNLMGAQKMCTKNIRSNDKIPSRVWHAFYISLFLNNFYFNGVLKTKSISI